MCAVPFTRFCFLSFHLLHHSLHAQDMPRVSHFLTALASTTLKSRQDNGTCHSYGMDFQSGGSYFQNSLSNDSFTFVEQFEGMYLSSHSLLLGCTNDPAGCNSDVAYNILVDPEGNQNLCSDTQLQPADTDELSTCPLTKNQLVSGNWSIIVISNNGDGGAPLAAQRDFVLSVGPQETSTVIPTVTAESVVNPIVNSTVTSTVTQTTYLPGETVTVPAATVTPTTTVTPAAVTSTMTKALLSLDVPSFTFDIQQVFVTRTASCILPTRASQFDPPAVVMPTLGPAATLLASLGIHLGHGNDRKRFVEERAKRLAHVKRAPDAQPLLVTETDTSKWSTVTATSTGDAVVATVNAVATSVTTIYTTVTVADGVKTTTRTSVTAQRSTRTKTQYVIATVGTSVTTVYHTHTIKTTTTPSAVAASCTSAGGKFRPTDAFAALILTRWFRRSLVSPWDWTRKNKPSSRKRGIALRQSYTRCVEARRCMGITVIVWKACGCKAAPRDWISTECCGARLWAASCSKFVSLIKSIYVVYIVICEDRNPRGNFPCVAMFTW